MSRTKQARVRALAKINLDLRVLERGPDGYHDLRTVFQTISLADTLDVAYTPARTTSITAAADIDIPGENLAARAAALALDAMRRSGRVEIRIRKKIPLGAGLGGGSSDAAAVLLTLPVLAGRPIETERLLDLARCLGSDVSFFLIGGTAIGIGRGSEVYPLEDRQASWGVLITPELSVSTKEAYRVLDESRALTPEAGQTMINGFQSCVWEGRAGVSSRLAGNDFEAVVFARHPRLKALKRRLERLGARPARLTGSGSALFGLFTGHESAERAAAALGKEQAFPIRLITRAQYRRLWRRQLGPGIKERTWPPHSRFA